MLTPLLTAIAGLFGGYFGAYMTKKGENKAIHEDIEKLVNQVKAVTQATKDIEAKISDDLWNRQKKWEIKKEALFRVVQDLSALQDSLSYVSSVHRTAKKSGDPKAVQWMTLTVAATETYNKASTAFNESQLIADLVCGGEVRRTLAKISVLLRTIANEVSNKDNPTSFVDSLEMLHTDMEAVRSAVRKELEIDNLP